MGLFIFATEVIYYSLFYKFTTKDKFIKYALLFGVSSITMGIIDIFNRNLAMFTFFILTYILLRKFINKISNADLIFLMIILLLKATVEILIILTTTRIIVLEENIIMLIMQSLKILLILMAHNKICYIYKKIKTKWNDNNFIVRHLFTTFISVYLIYVCLYLINR